ncbi:hypothetical protein CL620_00935 [archaeon]|nr:hypothetical protein [archaeon]
MKYEDYIGTECPRCLEIMKTYPALSRSDNSTYICSPCGTHEALEDFSGVGAIDKDLWPHIRRADRGISGVVASIQDFFKSIMSDTTSKGDK